MPDATRRAAAVPRVEHNADRTNTWGLHLEYERPLTRIVADRAAVIKMNDAEELTALIEKENRN